VLACERIEDSNWLVLVVNFVNLKSVFLASFESMDCLKSTFPSDFNVKRISLLEESQFS
jgi:hypothetical protein